MEAEWVIDTDADALVDEDADAVVEAVLDAVVDADVEAGMEVVALMVPFFIAVRLFLSFGEFRFSFLTDFLDVVVGL